MDLIELRLVLFYVALALIGQVFSGSKLFRVRPPPRRAVCQRYCNNVVIMTPHQPRTRSSKLFASDIALFDDAQLDQYLEANGRLECRIVESFTC